MSSSYLDLLVIIFSLWPDKLILLLEMNSRTYLQNLVNCFRGSYSDGKLKEPIKPCAGNVGTQITVGQTRLLLNVLLKISDSYHLHIDTKKHRLATSTKGAIC